MSVSLVRKRSASSATTRSFWALSTPSPPHESSPHAGGLGKAKCKLPPNAPRPDFCLAAADCLWRRAFVCRELCRNRLGLLHFEVLEDPASPRRVDLDPRAHRRRQRDLA